MTELEKGRRSGGAGYSLRGLEKEWESMTEEDPVTDSLWQERLPVILFGQELCYDNNA